MLASQVTKNNFLNTFSKYTSKFTEKYNEGLFGLVVALITFGLERLLDKEVFTCPRIGYHFYGIAFFVCPIVLLTLLNLLTVPSSGKVRIWTLCENCFVRQYWRRGDVFSGLFSAICVGLVAPSAWVFLTLLDGRHLVCWELGYQFGDKVNSSYLKDRGFHHLNVSEYMVKIDHAKARSHAWGVIFLGCAVLVLFFVIILRRSCLKPFSSEERLPGLCKFEKLEAFAAREELDRLFENDDNFFIIHERIVALEEEKKTFKDEKSREKLQEIELEIEELHELENVLKQWVEWQKCELAQRDEQDIHGTDLSLKDAKDRYEKSKKDLKEKRNERFQAAKEQLHNHESSTETTGEGVDVYHSWLCDRLKEQERIFDIEYLKSWQSDKSKIKTLVENFDSQLWHGGGFSDNPKLRGRVVTSYIVQQYKKQREGCRHIEQVMEKFRSIYPRAATSKPWQRYVNVDDFMYNYIIDEYTKKFSGSKNGHATIPMLLSDVKPWDNEKEVKWKNSLKKSHSHSWFWPRSCCASYEQMDVEAGHS